MVRGSRDDREARQFDGNDECDISLIQKSQGGQVLSVPVATSNGDDEISGL